MFEYTLTPTISTPGAGRSLQVAAAKHGVTLAGAHREPDLDVTAVYTHFATADDADSPLFSTQREHFEHARSPGGSRSCRRVTLTAATAGCLGPVPY